MSRKASPRYFKSRMSSLLNPLFLGSIATLALIAVVLWQFVLQPNNQLSSNPNPNPVQSDPNNASANAEGITNPETAAEAPVEEETIDPNFLSETTTGEEILTPISRDPQQQAQNRQVKLYDQLVGLGNLFPDLLPNQGVTNDPTGLSNNGGVAPQFSQTPNQFSQYQYRSNTSGVATSPTPLANAVNQVMATSNYYNNYARNVRQVPAQAQAPNPSVSRPASPLPPNGNPNNLNFPSITPTYYGGATAFTPTYTPPTTYGATPYGGAGFSPYGGGATPYGGAGFSPYGRY